MFGVFAGATVLLVFAHAKAQCDPAPSCLVAWWPGNGNAIDIIGGNDGTLENGATFAPGDVLQAFNFDGTNQYVQIADSPSLRPLSITVECWFNASNTQGALLCKPVGDEAADSYAFWFQSGSLNGKICSNDAEGAQLSYPFTPVAGTWYHAAYTFDNSSQTQTLYINGISVAVGNAGVSIGYDSNPVLIGADNDGGSVVLPWTGEIDEISVYSCVLTASEIYDIYAAGSLGKCVGGLSPIIVNQPTNVSEPRGAEAVFSVTAAGAGPLSYQWLFDGQSLSGATNATLTLSDVQTNQAGTYAVVVTNVTGSADSSNALLTVNVPPNIAQQPVSITAEQGANLTFTVSATGTAPLAYQWQFGGDNLDGATNAALALTNVQTNQAGLYSVVVTNIVGSTNSSNALLIVNVPLPNPVLSLNSPANLAIFCSGVTIPLLASVSNNVNLPTNVAFYAGSTILLGSVADAPYSFPWTNATPGTYSLTATASFADGSTLASSPALITISDQCGQGQVAIVRNSADPEIGLLQSNLFEIGLNSQVFDQAGLTFTALTNFELVIWDDLDGQTNRITDNTVTVLGSVFASGIPLYLIGANLASDALALDEPQRSQWIQLTSLTPATGKGGDGSVEITDAASAILTWNYGVVTNFSAPTNFDLTTMTNANASILGQSGAIPVLVANPGTDAVNPSQTHIVTQNFEVEGGFDTNSLAQRHALFLNCVCWLVGCQECMVRAWGFNYAVTNETALGQELTYTWYLANDGRCDFTGTLLSTVLPPGVQFVSAESMFGSWQYDDTLREVIFDVGLLPGFSLGVTTLTGSFTVLASQPGTLTNTMNASVNGQPPQEQQEITQVTGLSLLPLGGTNYVLELFGTSGQDYNIQTSTDLLQWLNWTTVQGPVWSAPVPTNLPWQYYRAIWQYGQ